MFFVNEFFKDYLKNIKSIARAHPCQGTSWFRVFGTENYIVLELINSHVKPHIYEVKYMIQVPLDEERYVFGKTISTRKLWVTFEKFFDNLPDDAKLEFIFHLDAFTKNHLT